jgi:hypothetical protein
MDYTKMTYISQAIVFIGTSLNFGNILIKMKKFII